MGPQDRTIEGRLWIKAAGAVAEVTIPAPPGTVWDGGLRAALAGALDDFEANRALRSMLVMAKGPSWPLGEEPGSAPDADDGRAGPDLAELCARFEAAEKPVVMALHGMVLGGGLELALCARYRVAEAGTRFGFAEVALGLMPSAGGTQRLPKLIGAGPALVMLTSGMPVSAERAIELGLVEAVTGDDLAATARGLAHELAGPDGGAFPSRDPARALRDPAKFLAEVAEARVALEVRPGPVLPAPARIIECVEAALLLPGPMAMQAERAAAAELAASPEAAALRHAYLAEGRAVHFPEHRHATARALSRLGVIGGDPLLGPALATALARAGMRVTLVEADVAALDRGLTVVAETLELEVARGRLAPEDRDASWARVAGSTVLSAVAGADAVIDASDGGEEERRTLFSALDRIVRQGAVMATTTSLPNLNRIAAATRRPADIGGLGFHGPAGAARLVEVIPGAATAADVTVSLAEIVRRIGKSPLRAGLGDGFIGERIAGASRMAADFLMEDGTSPYDIDRALCDHGFPLGPYQSEDRIGLTRAWERRKRLAASSDPARRHVVIGDRLCAMGRTGMTAGRGYYRYDVGQPGGAPDPEVLALIEAERNARGITPRRAGAAEIRARCLSAMANEGARLVEEGIARRPSDVDFAMLAGYGYPRHRGGPMHEADREGPLMLREALRRFAVAESWFWRPAALLDEMIKNGRHFADLNED